jgi:hypothetical protein
MLICFGDTTPSVQKQIENPPGALNRYETAIITNVKARIETYNKKDSDYYRVHERAATLIEFIPTIHQLASMPAGLELAFYLLFFIGGDVQTRCREGRSHE